MEKRDLPDIKEILDAGKTPPPKPPPEEPERTTRELLWAGAKWAVGIAALIYIAVDLFWPHPTKPPADPRHYVRDLKVLDSKNLGDGEELRIIWMPSDWESIGSRCLLYTNKANSASSLSCPSGADLAPEDPTRR